MKDRDKIASLPITMPASLPKQYIGTDLADRILILIKELGYRKPGLSEEINLDDVESMSHFGVIRDWTITLKDGRKIVLGADIIKKIVEHENKELRTPGRLLNEEEIMDAAHARGFRDGVIAERKRKAQLDLRGE